MTAHRLSNETLFTTASETGLLMQSIDWSQTPLGAVETWSQSLCTTVNILLNTLQPMCLFWSADWVMLYNNAYRNSLGAYHAQAMGQPAKVGGKEIWHIIAEPVAKVMSEAKPLQYENQPVLVVGSLAERYFTLSYSPVWDANQVAGTLLICTETTQQVLANHLQTFDETALQKQERQLQLALKAAHMVTWDWNVKTNLISRSASACEVLGLPFERLTEPEPRSWELMHPEDRLQHHTKVQQAIDTQGHYRSEFRIIRPDNEEIVWVEDRGQVEWDEQGNLTGIKGALFDINNRKQTEAALQDSEERFRLAARAVAGIVYDWNTQTDFVYRSEGLFELIGFHPAEVPPTRQWWSERVHPDDLFRIQASAQPIYESNNERYDFEYRVRHKAGDWVDVWDRGYLIRDPNGQITRIVGSTTDITARRQTEAALRQSEARFRQFVESNIIGVVIGNINGSISYANDAFLHMLGYSRQELQSGELRWTAMTPTEYLQLDQQAIEEIHRTGIATRYEKEFICKNGVHVPVLMGGTQLEGSEDMIAFVLDLTQRKQAEAEREQLLQREQTARAEAETANRVKDQFLAVLSHELRSPLNPILGWAKLLQMHKQDEATIERALQVIERNAKLQAELIDDLLDVSRILRGKMSLNVCPVNLITVIEAALETVQLSATTKSIQLQTHLMPEAGQVVGDAGRLQQIVWNLLSNAIKFTPPGCQIEIRLERVWDRISEPKEKQRLEQEVINSMSFKFHAFEYAQITVKDTGKGIEPEFLPHVFDYFRQADSSITRTFGGLGLGLAIVRHLVELHGGMVWAESQGEGQGATFVVRLPLLQTPVTAQSNQVRPPFPDLEGIHVLTIDDQPDMRDYIAVVLQQVGARATVATSATGVWQTITNDPPDILLIDIGMPNIDGYTLLRQIRALLPEQGGNIPAIALTAFATEQDRQQAIAAGFQLHLAKPASPEAVIQAIARLLKSEGQ